MSTTTRRQFLTIMAGAATPAVLAPRRTYGAASGPLRVGVNIPTTGPIARPAREVLIGLDMYFESIGYTVAGRKLEVIKEDETADVQTGVAKARKLIEKDQVECLIGGSLTSTIYATLPVVVSARTPYLVAMGGGAEVTRKKRRIRSPTGRATTSGRWAIRSASTSPRR